MATERSARILAALASVMFVVDSARGQTTRYVDDDAPGDPCPGDPTCGDPMEDGTVVYPFDAIQECIDACVDGDTCLVADGTFTGPGNRDLNFGGRLITVQSENGPATCIIDCEGAGRGFIFQNGESEAALVDGFTLTNGSAVGGGGVFIGNVSSPTIANCLIVDNSATLGGGMAIFNNSNPTITDCVFDGNEAVGTSADATGWGGGIFCTNSNPTIMNSTFSQNTATGGSGTAVGTGSGGGIYCFNGGNTMTIAGCTFTDNHALGTLAVSGRGGGIRFSNSSSPTVIDCAFIGNTAVGPFDDTIGYGGGMNCLNSDPTVTGCAFVNNHASYSSGALSLNNSDADVSDCTFVGNTSVANSGAMAIFVDAHATITRCTFRENSSARGGAVGVAHDGSPELTNCLFSKNTATVKGGAMWCSTANDLDINSSILRNCTFNGNTAGESGGAIFSTTVFGGETTPSLHSCILWDNSPDEIVDDFEAVTTVTYSDVQGGWPGEGNIDADPLFTAGPLGCQYLSQAAAGQFGEDSPCVDAGDPESPLVDGTTRTDEVADIGIVDMGYHYPVTGLIPGEPGVSADVCIYDGFIDARRESADGATLIGLESVTICLPTLMENIDGTPLDVSAFSITDTAGTPPSITGIEVDFPAVTINLSGPITLQEWTTISVSARALCDQLSFEDSIDIGYLPGDVDQSGCVNPLDLLRFKQYVNDIATPPVGVIEDFIDTDRSGDVNPLDLLAFKQLINGVVPPATQAWAGECLPAQP